MSVPAKMPDPNGQVALARLLNTKIRDAFSLSIEAANADHGRSEFETPDVSGSFDILDRAAKGIVSLGANLRQINDFVSQREAWFDSESERLRGEVEQWERAARASEAKIRELEKQLRAMTVRAESLEESMRDTRSTLNAVQDRVATLLGTGSEVDRVLSEIPFEHASESAAELSDTDH
jgi:chromosome segregation ATPase